jgi:hypothetical protein
MQCKHARNGNCCCCPRCYCYRYSLSCLHFNTLDYTADRFTAAVAAALLPCCAAAAPRPQDNGKPLFFSRNADVPLAYDHLRYYAG